MDKKITEVLLRMNFKIEGNGAIGIVDGYEVSCIFNKFANPPFFCHISSYIEDAKKTKVLQEIKNLGIPYFVPSLTRVGVMFNLNAFTYKKFLIIVEGVIRNVVEILKNNDCLGSEYCPATAKELDVDKELCLVNGFPVTLSSEGRDLLNAEIEKENKEFEEAPNNYLKGTAGAIIGALVGALCVIILGLVGFVSAVSAVVSVALGSYLFTKFGGKANKMMVLIVCLSTVIALTLGIYALYLITLHMEIVNNGILDKNVFQLFNEAFASNDEFRRLFIKDAVLNLVFTVVGLIAMIFTLRNKVHRDSTIK
ncbi:MAG: hypothetical protein J6Y42_00190 [Bacilli bacterium]|nr:hypothetical protein [Bacilli bacterium]